MTGVFVDDTVLVYAYDLGEPDKQERALQVLDVTPMIVLEARRGVRDYWLAQ